ncbi:MAG: hypothetical protein U0930_10990 [Pirellulales bacterium]
MASHRSVPQLTDSDRKWLEMRWRWLIGQFGDRRDKPIVLTEPEYFPEEYRFDEASVDRYLTRVCSYMDADRSRIQLHFHEELPKITTGTDAKSFAGLYVENGEQVEIWIEAKQLDDPLSLVATLAHEVGHLRLLGEKRVNDDEPDHEFLTDLSVIFFGLGIFTANSAVRESHLTFGQFHSWEISRLGYLSLPMQGYANALLGYSRGEFNPEWSRYLRPDVRSVFKQWQSTFEDTPPFRDCSYDPVFLKRYGNRISGLRVCDRREPDTQVEDSQEATCYFCCAPLIDGSDVCVQCQESMDENTNLLEEEYEDEQNRIAFAQKSAKHLLWLTAISMLTLVAYSIFHSFFLRS